MTLLKTVFALARGVLGTQLPFLGHQFVLRFDKASRPDLVTHAQGVVFMVSCDDLLIFDLLIQRLDLVRIAGLVRFVSFDPQRGQFQPLARHVPISQFLAQCVIQALMKHLLICNLTIE